MQETLSVKNGAIILMTGKKFRKEQNQAQQNWKMWTEMELLQLMIKKSLDPSCPASLCQ